MVLKRTTVYAEADDLATIKDAASRLGLAEAELIREAIHMAAMSHRLWDEPFFGDTFSVESEHTAESAEDELWQAKARRYRETRERDE
ncbi:MAG: hypothetical protein ACRDXX_16385 [Stackebrandtia sp.]